MIISGLTSMGHADQDQGEIKIAITQFLSHPALDQVRQSAVKELKRVNPKITFIFSNANGDALTAQQIAQQISRVDVDVVVAISTISMQSVMAQVRGSKPVFFGAITVPEALKLDKAPMVSGVSDYPPLELQVRFIKNIVEGIKKIAVIFNPGEDNSTAVLKDLDAIATQNALEIIRIPLEKLQNLPAAVARAHAEAEVIYIVNDNLVASGFPSLIKHAERLQIPVFSADLQHVELGAVGMVGYDYAILGQVLANKISNYLRNKAFDEPKIERLSAAHRPPKIYLNEVSARRFGLSFSENLKAQATKIF